MKSLTLLFNEAVISNKGRVAIRKSEQITSFGRLGVGGLKPVDVIISISVPVIELFHFKFQKFRVVCNYPFLVIFT